MVRPIYLDYMATTPVDPEVIRVMQNYLGCEGEFGNPSSQMHIYGWHARKAVDLASQQLADLIGATPEELIWTSGATESINLALKGAAQFYQRQGKHLITTRIEHKAVLETCAWLEQEGFEVTYLMPDERGFITIQALKEALRPDTILVSLTHVQGEIGVIQQLKELAGVIEQHGALLHVDAAQSLGKIDINVKHYPVALMSFSGHKLYAPKGIGALYMRGRPPVRLQPQIHGGRQQSMRSGTYATHQIVGMGKACVLAKQLMHEEHKRIKPWRDHLWQALQQLGGIHLNGDVEQSIAGTLNISIEGVEGEALMLSLRDLALSSGAACSSIMAEPSYVLRALGRSAALAHSSLRISLGRFTTETDVEQAMASLTHGVKMLRHRS